LTSSVGKRKSACHFRFCFSVKAEHQLGPSPNKIVLTAFKILAKDKDTNFDVQKVDKQNAVIYDSNN
jgi:hypothetical protein